MTKLKRAPVPISHCTGCGKLCDDATGLATERNPRPGDFTICFGCGHLMVYSDELTLRDPTNAEVVEVAGDPRLIAAQRVVAARKQNVG